MRTRESTPLPLILWMTDLWVLSSQPLAAAQTYIINFSLHYQPKVEIRFDLRSVFYLFCFDFLPLRNENIFHVVVYFL